MTMTRASIKHIGHRSFHANAVETSLCGGKAQAPCQQTQRETGHAHPTSKAEKHKTWTQHTSRKQYERCAPTTNQTIVIRRRSTKLPKHMKQLQLGTQNSTCACARHGVLQTRHGLQYFPVFVQTLETLESRICKTLENPIYAVFVMKIMILELEFARL